MREYFKKNKWAPFALLILFALNCYFIYTCSVIFWREMVKYNGLYPSDFPAHIDSGRHAVGYSIVEAVMGIIANAGNGSIPTLKLLGVMMAIVVWITIFVSYKLMRMIAKDADPVLLYAGVLAANVVVGYYIPQLNPYRYLGLQSGNIYHNSTYIGMKLCGTIVLVLYFKYVNEYEKWLTKEQWILFAESIILVNLTKPNFIVAFAPIMGVCLLIDLIRKKGKTFPQIFMFGLAVIPSVLVLLFEYTSLFPSGEGGLEFSIAYCLRLRTNHPVISVFQCMAFAFFVLVFHIKDLKKNGRFGFAWIFTLVNFLIYIFITESGGRKEHGNLSWGYCYGVYVAYMASIAMFVQDITALIHNREEKKPLWYYIVGGILLIGHLFFGIQYISIILAGKGFL